MDYTFTYTIILLTLLFLPFIIFLVFKKIFREKEVFLQNSIEKLKLERSMLEEALNEKERLVQKIEFEHLNTLRLNLELNEKSEQVARENEALRSLMNELQKKGPAKNDDIIIEHIFKP